MKGGKRKRKSRKKRGKGAMASRMSRKKKLSARKPKAKIHLDEAIQILENDQSYLIADIVERGRRIRNLALELEDNAKKEEEERENHVEKLRRKEEVDVENLRRRRR